MSTSTHWHLFCYDIADPRRLRRIHRFLKDEGLPLQYSVFLVCCTTLEMVLLLEKTRALINEKEDDVRIYPVSSSVEFVALGRQQLGPGMVLSGEGLIQLQSPPPPSSTESP